MFAGAPLAVQEPTPQLALVEAGETAPPIQAPPRTLTLGDVAIALAADSESGRVVAADRLGRLHWFDEGGEEVAVTAGHPGSTLALEFDRTGRWLASVGEDGRLRVWDASEATETQSLEAGDDWVVAVDWDDDRALAAACADGTVTVWDERGARARWQIVLPDEPTALEFSSLVPGLAVATRSGDLIWLDRASGAQQRTWTVHESAVTDLEFSPDGSTLASAGKDRTIALSATTDGEVRDRLLGHGHWVTGIEWSGNELISASSDGTLRTWDGNSGTLLDTFVAADRGVFSLSGDADTWWLAVHRPLVFGWPRTRAPRLETEGGLRAAACYHAAVDPTGRVLATAFTDGRIELWDLETSHLLRTVRAHHDAVTAVAFLADGQRAASASVDGSVAVWTVGDGALVGRAEGFDEAVNFVATHHRKALVAAGDRSGSIVVWNLDADEQRWIQAHADAVKGLAFHPEDTRLASVSDDTSLAIWGPNGELQNSTVAHDLAVHSVAWSPNGRWLVTGALDETLRIWDATNLELQSTTPGFPRGINTVRFGSDSHRVIAAGSDGHAWLVDVPSGEWSARLGPQRLATVAAGMDASGHAAWSAGADGTVLLFDLRTGASIRRVPAGCGAVTALSLEASGERVVVASEDGWVRTWRTAEPGLLAIADSHSAVRAVVHVGERVFVADEDGSVRLGLGEDGELLSQLSNGVRDLTVVGGPFLLVLTDDDRLCSLDVSDPEGFPWLDELRRGVAAVAAWGPDAPSSFLVLDVDGSLWRAALEEEPTLITETGRRFQRMALAPDRTFVVLADDRGNLRRVDLNFDRSALPFSRSFAAVVTTLTFLDEQRLLVGGRDGSLHEIDCDDGTILSRHFGFSSGAVTALIADRSRWLVGTAAGELHCFDANRHESRWRALGLDQGAWWWQSADGRTWRGTDGNSLRVRNTGDNGATLPLPAAATDRVLETEVHMGLRVPDPSMVEADALRHRVVVHNRGTAPAHGLRLRAGPGRNAGEILAYGFVSRLDPGQSCELVFAADRGPDAIPFLLEHGDGVIALELAARR